MTSQVVINDVEPRTQAIAFSNQTVFNTNWTADAASDINVYSRADGVPADDQTQLVSSSDYMVEFIGTYETVRITFSVPRNANDIVTIVRNTPSDRENLYTNTNFTPSMLNQDFGILTMVDQQNQMYDQDFCPHYNLSAIYTDTNDIAIDLILPILEGNQFWVKNVANTAFVPATLPSGGTNLPNGSPFVTYMVDVNLTNAQNLGLLSDGILQQSVVAGVSTIFSNSTPVITQIRDPNGNAELGFNAVANAVNYFSMTNSATGNPVILAPVGSDTNISMDFVAKGTGFHGFNTTVSSNAIIYATGTGYQHITGFTFPNTAATRTVTWPDASGTVSLQTTGSWTPGISFGGAAVGITYTTQTGEYTQIGNIVYYSFYIELSNQGSSTGDANITGFPVNFSDNINYNAVPINENTNLTSPPIMNGISGSTNANLTNAGGANQVTEGNFTNTSIFSGNGFYFIS